MARVPVFQGTSDEPNHIDSARLDGDEEQDGNSGGDEGGDAYPTGSGIGRMRASAMSKQSSG